MYNLEDFRQETMFGPLAPLLNIGYFLGAIPYSLSTNNLSSRQKLFRLVQILYESVLIAGLITSVVVLRMYTREFDSTDKAPPFIKLFYIVEHILDMFLIVGICYGEQLLRASFKGLLDQLDDLLQMFGHVAVKILNQRKLFAIIAILANLAVQVAVIWSCLDTENIRIVPLLVTIHVPLTITVTFVQMYCFMVTSITRIIREVNKRLNTLVKRFNEPFSQAKPPYREVSRLRKIHLQTVDLLEQTNEATGVLVIFILSSTFANMNSHCLFLYNVIKLEDKNPDFVRIIIEINLLMLLRVLKVLTVIIPNSLVKKENHKAANILCKFEDSENEKFNWVVRTSQ